jgi:hypothetical protein|tara:strand:+ start:374 stop:553 length:180 start_codon:yes stop_codon:yes gene_type:complete
MALDTESIIAVKKLIKEFNLNEEFEKIFLKHLENESNFQCGDEDRLEVISLLREQLKNG